MNIYEIIKVYGKGKNENDMWATTEIISDAIEQSMPENERKTLYEKIYGYLSEGHYDENFAKEAIAHMFYNSKDGQKHSAPYFTDSTINEIYGKIKDKIRGYNVWDFAVTLNMVASDYHNLIIEWFPDADAEARIEKYTALAVNWLSDEDWQGKNKIWCYLH